MNRYGRNREAFLFIIDFEFRKAIVLKPDEIDPCKIMFSFGNFKNYEDKNVIREALFNKYPPLPHEYQTAFDEVMKEIRSGNTYLLNLTFRSKIETDLKLRELYYLSRSHFKLFVDDQFVVFSPEIFVKITEGHIFSHPMKGTADAGIENAYHELMNNEKEIAEHYTIVDLIRNDLSMVAEDVRVNRLRYVEPVKTNRKDLLQVSSEITGLLTHEYQRNLGNLFAALLPAGSICGAPKQKTVEIIKRVENYERGFYTGVAGYFDGKDLESYVLIRFIEKIGNDLYYKSGGGITFQSNLESEYNELIDKIYLPI